MRLILFTFFIFGLMTTIYGDLKGTIKHKDGFMFYSAPGHDIKFNRLSEVENVALQISCGILPKNINNSSPKFEMMVENGQKATAGDYPWSASLSASRMEDLNNRCGAIIISPRHLLTAAHCFYDYKVKAIPCDGASKKDDYDYLKISFGGACLRKDKEYNCNKRDVTTIKVRRFAVYEAFNKNNCNRGHDMAIIELESDIHFNHNVQPACVMGSQKSNIREQKKDLFSRALALKSAGWGKDNYGKFSTRLQYFSANFTNTNTDDFGGRFSESDILDAIGNDRINGGYSNICAGDSGGGTVAIDEHTGRYVAVGLHSYSNPCNEPDLVGPQEYSFTMVNAHLSDICSLTGVCPPGVSVDEPNSNAYFS